MPPTSTRCCRDSPIRRLCAAFCGTRRWLCGSISIAPRINCCKSSSICQIAVRVLIFDLDSTVVTTLGKQDGAEVGYHPKYRGKRSYNPLLCLETNSSFLWDAELRPGNAAVCESSYFPAQKCGAKPRVFMRWPADCAPSRAGPAPPGQLQNICI